MFVRPETTVSCVGLVVGHVTSRSAPFTTGALHVYQVVPVLTGLMRTSVGVVPGATILNVIVATFRGSVVSKFHFTVLTVNFPIVPAALDVVVAGTLALFVIAVPAIDRVARAATTISQNGRPSPSTCTPRPMSRYRGLSPRTTGG